jgi:hypothetical protein
MEAATNTTKETDTMNTTTAPTLAADYYGEHLTTLIVSLGSKAPALTNPAHHHTMTTRTAAAVTLAHVAITEPRSPFALADLAHCVAETTR